MVTSKIKKTCAVSIVLFTLSVSLFAHEKGDIVINPEFQGGFVFPVIVPDFKDMGINGNDAGSVGFDYAAKVTGNYFFRPDFSANVGIGIGGLLVFSGYDYDSSGTEVIVNNTYRTTYFTVPFGVRYTIGTFLVGGGFAVVMPFESYHEGKNDGDDTVVHDDDFKANPFLGWYVDLGFDFAHREGKRSGFGAAVRIGSSFSDIANNTAAQKFTNFSYTNISLVLNYMFAVNRSGNN